jgi:methionyl-tRNA synthetase
MSVPFLVDDEIDIEIAAPHIGHLHTLVLTDTYARFARLRNTGREVLFNTGTDEHGMKIQQAAKKAGLGEREFCDGVSERFRVGHLMI